LIWRRKYSTKDTERDEGGYRIGIPENHLIIELKISDHQQSWWYEEGLSKGPGSAGGR